MTIEERALVEVPADYDFGVIDSNREFRSFYIRGAQKQKKIDIDNACKAFCKYCGDRTCDIKDIYHCNKVLDFKEIMKGCD